MKLIVVLGCLAVAISGSSVRDVLPKSDLGNIFPSGKIVGGGPINVTDTPWQVALEWNGGLRCGGSILSKHYVLTAAHCTDGTSSSSLQIRYGTSLLEEGGQVVDVQTFFQNPDYDSSTIDYDVSIIRVAHPIEFSDSVQAVTLRRSEANANETAQVSGWGALNEGDLDLPGQLQRVSVPVVSREDCNEAYDGAITDRMICGGEAGRDSCQGDSGGPFTVDDIQVGIVSWGQGCAEEGYPGVYSNVASLADYINKHTNHEAIWVD